jgi:hypothetical protein
MVDIIFEQPNIAFDYSKILQWFIYDRPKEDLCAIMGTILKDEF